MNSDRIIFLNKHSKQISLQAFVLGPNKIKLISYQLYGDNYQHDVILLLIGI
jgi:hypothetical protein